MSTTVTNDLNDDEIRELVQKVAEEYGVDTKDVFADINYEVSGGFTVENVDPSQVDDVVDTIKNSISQLTGVSVSEIAISYNGDSGEISYTIQSETYDESNSIQENISNDSFANEIKTSLSDVDSHIDTTSPRVDESIVADINIIVDGKDTVDMDKATNNLGAKFSEDGFDVEKAEGRSHSNKSCSLSFVFF